VLDRPANVKPLVESLNLSVEAERSEGWAVRAVFVCTLGDDAEIAAVRAQEVELLFHDGGYAAKCNHATRLVDVDWYLTAADDLKFHLGWLRAAISAHIRTGALVVGTNDMHNPSVVNGFYATHLLVHRDYVERGTIDKPGVLMHEGYDHNCVDTELVETAKSRGMFAFAGDARVEHLHPIWKGAPDDATYRRGRENHAADRRLLAVRRRLWTSTAVQRRRLRASRVRR
jgi:hypothetical protein